ncbi:transcription-associated protein 1-like [Belonocnema kinseyi]|uniref:transcription-associated protein 1-like n=1 Tax=Belonocnema kinseyi TaxID=2817044 RepID=UPI00143DD5B8|nr:transcription-associated protein 1-like [Belonocnema kinseyi]
MTTLDPQMNTYKSFVNTLGEPNTKDEIKLKAAQELSENLDTILASPHYPAFLAQLMKICLHILRDGQPQFIAENHLYKVRKIILEILQRLPKNEYFKPYVSDSLKILLKLLQTENEENVVISIKIIFDLYKQFKPPFHPEILQCLHFIKLIYNQLPINMPKMFRVKPPIIVDSLQDLNIESHLKQIFTITTIQTTKASSDGNQVTYNIVPRSALSLKFLQDFTHIIAFWLRMYRQNVEKVLVEIVPLVAKAIILEPNLQETESTGFNKEVFLDFVWARIRCLTFLGAVMQISPHLVRPHSNLIIKGIFRLFNSCPKEASNIRKELLIGMKHFMGTDLKTKFIPYLDILLDEKTLSGSGWMTHETFRPTAIITVGDYAHHVRHQLSFPAIKKVVNFFSKRLHDQSLPSTVQIFSSRVLFNFIECIKVQPMTENNQGRELLVKILEVYVLKFEAIAKLILPTLVNKSKSIAESEPKLEKFQRGNLKTDVQTIIAENRNVIKYLVLGTKSISYKLCEYKQGDASSSKQFHPKDTLLFIRMLKWSLQALDVYKFDRLELAQSQGELQKLKLKEEKELLDHFFPIFTMMNPLTFREIFSTMIEYMMDCTFKNRILETITNGFLVNPVMSPIFGAILSEYLLERMEYMASNNDRSDFYLRYFKIVFGSVSFSPVSSEHMLCPNLEKIVSNALKFATTAKEPLRYFLLLRALFRSICGGSHDLLYQKFLPLLPKLLEDLNRFQSGLHKHQMKELLIELCLTVPW